MEEMQKDRQEYFKSKYEFLKTNEIGFVATNLIGFKKDHPDAIIPTKAEPEATGYDLSSIEDVVIEPGEHKLVSTGLKWEAKDMIYQSDPVLVWLQKYDHYFKY